MNSRTRRQSPMKESPSYLRYLKPGALAQLRNSRISAHRIHPPAEGKLAQISSPPRSSVAAPTQIDWDGPPSPRRIYGPRCPQKKKLMAVKGFFCAGPNLIGHVSESGSTAGLLSSSDSVILVAQ